MKAIPKIGARVAFRDGRRSCVGVVVAQYPGYGEVCRNEETGEEWIASDHVGVRVECIPEWWRYVGVDRFAPDIAHLRVIK